MFSRVYVEITNICNKNCSFCHGHSRKPKQMSLPEFSYILDKLQGQTEYIYYHLMGEPLTHKELPDFIKTANEKGFRSVITTNGSLLKERGDNILLSGVHKISVSLHSFEKGDEKEFYSYLEQVADFARIASDKGIIVVLRLWNKGFDNGKNEDIYNFLKKRLPGEWTENTKGVRIRNKLHLEWGERFEWPDKNAEIQGEEFYCYALKDHFGILCDGSVVPCCMDYDGNITLGNIFKEDISEIVGSERASKMVNGFISRKATEDFCKRCSYAQRFV